MTPTPEVKPLPHLQRRIIFICSILVFCVTVPLLVFYAVGYRFDFAGEVSNIKSVGGVYVTSEIQDIEMYIDDEPVEDMRIFQNAAYIQNLEADIHQVHTQSAGLQTWIKELPVFSHFVTEVQSFNMPTVPQIRLVTEYETLEGSTVLFDEATTTKFIFASTTNIIFQATTTATTTYELNPEFVYIETLFASSSEEKLLLKRQQELIEENRFTFGPVTPTTTSTISATTTKLWRDVQLSEKEGDVYAQWTGKDNDIPYYFCVNHEEASSTISLYGQHVYDALLNEYGTTSEFSNALYVTDRICRTEIRIDRLWQSVQWFDFLPGSRDHILMQLQDGVYVVEIDDHSWQNVQLLYPGDYLQVVLDGGRILIKDDEYYVEVFTELQQ
ncbi:MAG: hypothetical protein ACI92I_000223 [Acidimicrobiales bacterium]|jgi:hypothetical protein